MNRRIGLAKRVERKQINGQFYYIDPIMGMDSQLFDTIKERDAEIAQHYIEPDHHIHAWVEQSRTRSRYEPGMVHGVMRCSCGATTHYTKEED